MKIFEYDVYLFDFDGVIFDTNFIKKNAIYSASKEFLHSKKLDKFIDYFLFNSGIPRDIKISKFFNKKKSEIIKKNYSKILNGKLIQSKKIPGVVTFLNKIKNKNKEIHILSGGNKDEIIKILDKNKMLKYFNQILTSPSDKQSNLDKLDLDKNIIFFGDSYHDYNLALKNNIDFVFVYGFTIQYDWKNLINKNKCLSIIKNFYKQ